MTGYFSFRRLITASLIKAIYLFGFLLLTAGGIGLAAWAGWQLNNATISRELGWRYFGYGIGTLIIGNLLWRITCEFWIVIFNIHDELVMIGQTFTPDHVYVEERATELDARPDPVTIQTEAREERLESVHNSQRAGILGLS